MAADFTPTEIKEFMAAINRGDGFPPGVIFDPMAEARGSGPLFRKATAAEIAATGVKVNTVSEPEKEDQ